MVAEPQLTPVFPPQMLNSMKEAGTQRDYQPLTSRTQYLGDEHRAEVIMNLRWRFAVRLNMVTWHQRMCKCDGL